MQKAVQSTVRLFTALCPVNRTAFNFYHIIYARTRAKTICFAASPLYYAGRKIIKCGAPALRRGRADII